MAAPGHRSKVRRRRWLRRARKEAGEGLEDAVEDGWGCGCLGEGCLGLALAGLVVPWLAGRVTRRLR